MLFLLYVMVFVLEIILLYAGWWLNVWTLLTSFETESSETLTAAPFECTQAGEFSALEVSASFCLLTVSLFKKKHWSFLFVSLTRRNFWRRLQWWYDGRTLMWRVSLIWSALINVLPTSFVRFEKREHSITGAAATHEYSQISVAHMIEFTRHQSEHERGTVGMSRIATNARQCSLSEAIWLAR